MLKLLKRWYVKGQIQSPVTYCTDPRCTWLVRCPFFMPFEILCLCLGIHAEVTLLKKQRSS